VSREERIAAQEAHDFAYPPEPMACPFCLADRSDIPPQKEDHAPVLRAALKDVIAASLETAAMETVPRKLWLALRRAEDVLADVDGIPF